MNRGRPDRLVEVDKHFGPLDQMLTLRGRPKVGSGSARSYHAHAIVENVWSDNKGEIDDTDPSDVPAACRLLADHVDAGSRRGRGRWRGGRDEGRQAEEEGQEEERGRRHGRNEEGGHEGVRPFGRRSG